MDKTRKPAVIILVDTREQAPLYFGGAETRLATLATGDYSIAVGDRDLSDIIAIERKSMGDLFGTVGAGRERFERELERSRTLRYFGIVIEATMPEILAGARFSRISPKAVVGSLLSWSVKFGAHVFFTGDRRAAAATTRKLLTKAAEYFVDGE